MSGKALSQKPKFSISKNGLFFGIAIFVISYGLLYAAFYFRTVENNINNRTQQVLQMEFSRYIEQNKVMIDMVKQQEKEKAEKEEEKRKVAAYRLPQKEGILWFDKETSLCVVTLGSIDGLEEGMFLTIYEDSESAGQIKVLKAFDIISYAEAVDKDPLELQDIYFRVIID